MKFFITLPRNLGIPKIALLLNPLLNHRLLAILDQFCHINTVFLGVNVFSLLIRCVFTMVHHSGSLHGLATLKILQI